jgi:hypothetical protein
VSVECVFRTESEICMIPGKPTQVSVSTGLVKHHLPPFLSPSLLLLSNPPTYPLHPSIERCAR